MNPFFQVTAGEQRDSLIRSKSLRPAVFVHSSDISSLQEESPCSLGFIHVWHPKMQPERSMYVYYTCVCVYIYVYVDICLYICIYIYVYVYRYIKIYIDMYIYRYIKIYIYRYRYIYREREIFVCMYV